MTRPLACLALTFALIASCSCGAALQHAPPGDAGATYARLPVVLIATVCPEGTYAGTGAVVSNDEVLTARHMVECEDIAKSTPWKIVAYVRGSHPVPMAIEFVASDRDAARLVTAPDAFAAPVAGVEVGPRPKPGDVVCWRHAWPSLGERCGVVDVVTDKEFHVAKEPDGAGAPAEPGNSGSAVYDAQGRIVGVAVRATQDDYTHQWLDMWAVDVTGAEAWVATPGVQS
jgi:hypothetical protein